MNIKFSFMALLALAVVILPGCGVRKKSLLLKLSPGLTKRDVERKMGKPDEIHCPIVDAQGDVVDIWEYNLATVDESRATKRTVLQVGGWLLFWPLLLFPSAWQAPYDYDGYLLKFVNDLLCKWGRRFEMDMPGAIYK